jgi:hypothetical protein
MEPVTSAAGIFALLAALAVIMLVGFYCSRLFGAFIWYKWTMGSVSGATVFISVGHAFGIMSAAAMCLLGRVPAMDALVRCLAVCAVTWAIALLSVGATLFYRFTVKSVDERFQRRRLSARSK